jgi:TATA-binding protein-associated factor
VLALLWNFLVISFYFYCSFTESWFQGKLVAFPEVIDILGNSDQSKPLSSLAPTLFAFFRHTIANVRLQVITTLHSFLLVDELPKDWLSSAFLCLLFQNLLVEERAHIRDATLSIWRTAVGYLSSMENVLPAIVSSPLISDWYALMLQPWGHPLDTSLFFQLPPHGSQANLDHGRVQEKHNVDKAMLGQDVGLVTAEVIWESRIACAQAMGYLIAIWPNASEAVRAFPSALKLAEFVIGYYI